MSDVPRFEQGVPHGAPFFEKDKTFLGRKMQKLFNKCAIILANFVNKYYYII